MNYTDEEYDEIENDVINSYDGKPWYRDYICPNCGYIIEDYECDTAYAPIVGCPKCGTIMN